MWEDDVMKGVKYTVGLLNYMLKERAQLYGALIKSMQNGAESFEISKEDLDEIGKKYYVLFTPNKEKETLTVELKEQDSVNSEGN